MIGALVAGITGSGGASLSSYESIATATATGSSGTITFSSIPSTYKHLQIRGIAFSTGGDGDEIKAELNNDSGTNYASHRLFGNGTTVTANGAASGTYFPVSGNFVGTSTTNANAIIMDILDYTSTSKNKTVRIFSGVDLNGTGQVNVQSALYFPSSITAISTLKIQLMSGNFSTSSTFALYGIKEA